MPCSVAAAPHREGGELRVFAAIGVPQATASAIAAALDPLRAPPWPLRWVDPASLHLTLFFIGATQLPRVDAAAGALRHVAAQHRPFEVRCGGLGAFPSFGRPRVLWLGVADSPALAALQTDVAAALAAQGFPPESKPFSPHVTLARVARRVQPAALEGLAEAAASFDFRGRFGVDTVELKRSRTGRSGAQYDTLVRAALDPGAGPHHGGVPPAE
jgi:RNA 2',3'-cyclic 3'-phosphodiesterase